MHHNQNTTTMKKINEIQYSIDKEVFLCIKSSDKANILVTLGSDYRVAVFHAENDENFKCIFL